MGYDQGNNFPFTAQLEYANNIERGLGATELINVSLCKHIGSKSGYIGLRHLYFNLLSNRCNHHLLESWRHRYYVVSLHENPNVTSLFCLFERSVQKDRQRNERFGIQVGLRIIFNLSQSHFSLPFSYDDEAIEKEFRDLLNQFQRRKNKHINDRHKAPVLYAKKMEQVIQVRENLSVSFTNGKDEILINNSS